LVFQPELYHLPDHSSDCRFRCRIYCRVATPVWFHWSDHRSPNRDLADDSGHYPHRNRGYQCLWCSHHKSTDRRDNFCSTLASINLSNMVSPSSLLLPPVLSYQQGFQGACQGPLEPLLNQPFIM